VSEDDAPKSAYEIILERLKKKDHDEGVEDRPVTDEQRARIAEVRKVYEARLAEREILYQAARRKAQDLETLDKLEEEYRRDRERIVSERDRKIDEARAG
jgi:aminoglycoside phosphotransferase